MANRSFGDNASSAANTPRAFGSEEPNDLSHVLNSWKEQGLQKLQAVRQEVRDLTHGHPTEAAVVGAAAAGVVIADIATRGKLSALAHDALPTIEKTLARGAGLFGRESELGALAKVTARADVDARLKTAQDFIGSSKIKSVSIGDLDGWKKVELQRSVNGDKVVRGLTVDLKESMAAHTQVSQELQIANRDQTQLTTELKGLKQLRSETVDSELTADSSPSLKRFKAAQQNVRDLATSTSKEERDGARRAMETARENFDKAKAAAPTRIDQIEGTQEKPGLLPRVEKHIADLQTQASEHLDTIGSTAKQAQARVDALKQNGGFEKTTSEEDIALRKREGQIRTGQASSILTNEERTGIAAPPAKAVEAKVVDVKSTPATTAEAPRTVFTPAAEVKSPIKFEERPVEKPATPVAQPVREATIAPKEAPRAPREEVPKEAAAKPAEKARESSGFASIDNTLASAEAKVQAFVSGHGSIRTSLSSLREYTQSVSEVMKTEPSDAIRGRVISDAVTNLERLLQPLAPPGRKAVEALPTLGTDRKFMDMSATIEKRISGIEKAAAARAGSGAEAARPADGKAFSAPVSDRPPVASTEALKLSPDTRNAIDAMAKVQKEIPADAKIYAVRTDGKIVDLELPSSRQANVTRVVPKRVTGQQLNDLGVERVLVRNFGKDNDIAGFVVVETKRDANGAEIIANAGNVRAAAANGTKIEPIPDQIVSRVIGNVPEELTKPGRSFVDFVAKFKHQHE